MSGCRWSEASDDPRDRGLLHVEDVGPSVVHGTPIVTLNYDAGETIGWPAFVAELAAAYRSLPPPSARINPRMDRARREVNPWSDASRMRVHIIYAIGEG